MKLGLFLLFATLLLSNGMIMSTSLRPDALGKTNPPSTGPTSPTPISNQSAMSQSQNQKTVTKAETASQPVKMGRFTTGSVRVLIMFGERNHGQTSLKGAGKSDGKGRLSEAEYEADFSPLQTDYDQAILFLSENHISVTYTSPDRLLLEGSGDIADVERAFNTEIDLYGTQDSTIYKSSTEVVVPALTRLGVTEVYIGNMTSTPNIEAYDASPIDLRNAYGTHNVVCTGQGQIIGIVDSYGDPTILNDVDKFDSSDYYNLPACDLHIYGNAAQAPATGPGSTSPAETAMDVEWAHAMAPGAEIMLQLSADSTPNNMIKAVNELISRADHPDVISLSWGWNESEGPRPSSVFSHAVYLGIQVYASSGDSGAYNGGSTLDVMYPASDPNVTAVGGTILCKNTVQGTDEYYEYGWAIPGTPLASGGGYSNVFPEPDYQTKAQIPDPTSKRAIPDVSMMASPDVLTILNQNVVGQGGTSLATPLMAGIAAVALEWDWHLNNPTLYGIYQDKTEYESIFHDVYMTTDQYPGNNGYYTVGPGWDPVTGLGSINFWNFLCSPTSITLSGHSVAPQTIAQGEPFSLSYTIDSNSARTDSLTQIGLGASIRLHGTDTVTVDTSNDIYVTMPSTGESTQERDFGTLPSLPTGWYDVDWALWMGPPGYGNCLADTGWVENQLQVVIDPSSISLNMNPLAINTGSGTTINGAITSPISGDKTGTVYIQYYDGVTWRQAGKTTSTSSGSYSFWWGPPKEGTYTVRTYWNGNAQFGGATSGSSTLTVTVSTEPGPQVQWTQTYGTSAYYGSTVNAFALSMSYTDDGGFVLAGSASPYDASPYSGTSYALKTDSAGNKLWDISEGFYEMYQCIAKARAGGYAIAGPLDNTDWDTESQLIKLDSSGATQWSQRYTKNYFGYCSWPNCLIQTQDGGYALAGYEALDWYHATFQLIKTDDAGNMQWNKTYGGSAVDKAYSLIQTVDGGYLLVGTTTSFGAGAEDVYIVKTDSDGNLQWSKFYGGANSDCAMCVVQANDGGYAIAGYTSSYGAGQQDGYLLKIDSSGNLQWSKTFGGTGNDVFYSIIKTADGGYALAGSTSSFGAGGNDLWFVETDSNGNQLSSLTAGGPNDDQAHAILQTSDGGFALAGYTNSYSNSNYECWLVKLSPPPSIIDHPPNKPVNPDPSDGRTGTSLSVTLSVDVSDPDGDPLRTTFYDGATNTPIGATYASSGSRASIQWAELQSSSTYTWYVVVDDGRGGTATSDKWSFTTKPQTNTIVVPDDYPTIQQAVDAANDGNTIIVKSGTYPGDVTVSKSNLIIASQNAYTALVLGSFSLNGVSNVTIANFKILGQDAYYSSGISFEGASFNTIRSNDISDWTFALCFDYYTAPSDNNTILENDIGNCTYAIFFNMGFTYNRFYHNNFYSTTVYNELGSTEFFDNGYPSGGNYWSGYSGEDTYSGPYQNITGSDGIGDTPYVIDANNLDNYPLMNPYQINQPPNKPENLSPIDGSTGVRSPDLSVEVSDPNGDTMTVSFYDASTQSLIATISNVTSGSVASIAWSGLSPATTYSWYAIADDGKGGTTQSDTWSFTTRTTPLTIIVPDDYATIQEAVNNALQGDTIYVRTGTYTEDVVIKSNLNIIGENRFSTIVRGGFSAGEVGGSLISNFTIIGGAVNDFVFGSSGSDGIWLEGSSLNTISYNIITGCDSAIELFNMGASCDNNTIVGNDIYNNTYGLNFGLTFSWNRIYHNNFNNTVNVFGWYIRDEIWDNGYPSGGNYWSDYVGNDTFQGPYQNVTGSDGIGDTPYAIDSINIDHYPLMNPYMPGVLPRTIVVPDDYPTIQEAVNNASAGDTVYVRSGVYNENVGLGDNLTIIGEDKYSTILNGGFSLIYCTGDTISNFTIIGGGIYLQAACFNTITNNIIENCGAGITFQPWMLQPSWVLQTCENNTVVANDFQNNNIGLLFSGLSFSNNKIYHNNFNDTTNVAVANPAYGIDEIWDDGYPSGGNYWNDYIGNDTYSGPNQNQTGSDGIGDTPYMIDAGNLDHYPLWNPYNSTLTVNHRPNKPSNPQPADGDSEVSLPVTLSVRAFDPEGDLMNVTFYDAGSDAAIGTVQDVPSGSTASIQWDDLCWMTSYSWYAVADDGNNKPTRSDTWYFMTCSSPLSPQTIVVPIDYPTIQQAVNNASNGDIVLIKGGTYAETIKMKSNITVTGEDKYSTILQGGFNLIGTQNCAIENLTIIGGGILLNSASFNTIDNNIITRCGQAITVCEDTGTSDNNTITQNDIYGNNVGLFFYVSYTWNRIFHNNFNNTNNVAKGSTPPLDEIWDDGYPSGGNYWNDYIGNDIYSGPNQNQTGSDGIGDTPYMIDANNFDNYPLWNPYGSTSPVNHLPSKPACLNPLDGFSGASISPTLTVSVFDPDGDPLNVTFYNAGTDSPVASSLNVPSGSVASYQWNGLYWMMSYQWYVIVDDGRGGVVRSDTWGFTTQSSPLSPQTLVVPTDYPTIQQAVYNASNGDTILVKTGTYHETINIKNNVTVIGEDRHNTIIYGGFNLVGIENATIMNFTVTEGGFFLNGASFNTIKDNIITGCGNAITLCEDLGSCDNNTITENDINANNVGVYFYTAYSRTWNRFYHNNFTNTVNVASNTNFDEIWDDGYPSGGNYWNDYIGNDTYSGPYQNQTGSDGIGDTPYMITRTFPNMVLGVDNYPLMSPYVPPSPAGYQITFDETGVFSDFTGTIVTIDGKNYSATDLPVSFLWSINSVHNFSYAYSLIAGEGKQYIWASTTGLSTTQNDTLTTTTSGTVTGNYLTQYAITFDQKGLGNDFSGTLVTIDGCNYGLQNLPATFWWNENSNHTFSYAPTLSVDEKKQYIWASTSGLSTQQSSSEFAVPNNPGSIIGIYETQYNMTVTTSPPSATGGTFEISYTQSGTAYQNVAQTTTWWGWVDSNSIVTVTGAQDPINGPTGTQYVFDHYDPSNSVNMSQANTITLSYITQYQVTFEIYPPGNGTITPSGTAWFDSGNLLVSANPVSIRYKFTNWSTTDHIDLADQYASSTNATINGPGTITANFALNIEQITIDSNPEGSGFVNVDGANVTTPDMLTWVVGDTHTLEAFSVVPGSPGTEYTFTSWSDLGNQTHSYTVPASVDTVTANYKTQFQITFDQMGLGSDFTGAPVTIDGTDFYLPHSFWWDNQSVHSYAFKSPLIVTANSKQYVWTSTAGLSTQESGSIIVSASGYVNGSYRTQYYLTVNSARDSPVPPSGWFDAGTAITASVTSPLSGGAGTQYVCTGWSGLGSVPASGAPPSMVFVISAPSSITWNWKTQYYLAVVSPYDSPTPLSGWFDNGTSITESVTSPSLGPTGTRYVCTGWTGTGSVRKSGSAASTTFTIRQPSDIAWNWKTQYILTMARNFGTILPSAGSHWYDSGSLVNISATSPSTQVGGQFLWNGWTGLGSGSYTGLSNPVLNTVAMNGPVNETASWIHQYLLTINTSGIRSPYSAGLYLGGDYVGNISDNSPFTVWITAGTSTGTIGVDTQISDGSSVRYVFVSWNPGSSVNPRPAATMNAPKTFTANYKTQYKIAFSQSGVLNDFTGTVVKIDKVNYSVSNLPASFWWDAGSSHTFQFISPLKTSTGQYVWTSTIGLSTLQSGTITISSAGTVNAIYVKR